MYWTSDTSFKRKVLVWNMWPPLILNMSVWSNPNQKLWGLLWCRVQILYKDICILHADQNETTNIGIGALYVLVGAMLHAATTTQLKIMSMTTVFNQTNGEFHNSLKLLLYRGQNQWQPDPCFLTGYRIYPHSGKFRSNAENIQGAFFGCTD